MLHWLAFDKEPFVSGVMALLLFSDCHQLPGISMFLIFHSPIILSIADGHRKNTCLTGHMWVNWNCLSHVFSIVFHHSFSVCHPAPLLQWMLCLSGLCRCCYSWNSSFLLNNVHISKVSHALHSNPIPLYASVWVCGNSERLLLVLSDMGHAES